MPPPAFMTRVPSGPPRNLLWTVAQFYALGDLGCFEGRRASLINGVIVEEGPMNPPHRIALELTDDAMRAVFRAGWRVCIQMPLELGQLTAPFPDVAIVAGTPRGPSARPATAALVIEVADTSLNYDLTPSLQRFRRFSSGGRGGGWVCRPHPGSTLVAPRTHGGVPCAAGS